MYAIRSYYGQVSDEQLTKAVKEVFDMRPYFIQERLQLRRPIFQKTTNYGHFGRELPEFTWEQTDAVADLRTRITSYNVCYTKLLRQQHDGLLLQPRR